MQHQRQASVTWHGSLQKGQGWISTFSGVLTRVPYSFSTRFDNVPGTNPEELIAAAHASCFSMALAAKLSQAGWEARSIKASAVVSLEKTKDSWSISSSRLSVEADVPRMDQESFALLAEDAKANCPISRVLNTTISLDSARLISDGKAAQPILDV